MTGRDQAEAEFKRTLDGIIKTFEGRIGASAPAPFAGAENNAPLEQAVRKQFLDKVLDALGWDLSRFELDVVEEARVHGDTTLFLDYLGAHPIHRTPILIFEAKAWNKPLIRLSKTDPKGAAKEPELHELVSMALEHCKSGEADNKCPVLLEWKQWLNKLIDYVKGMKEQSGHVVSRVAIGSGQWLIIFTDPENAFLSDVSIKQSSILAYRLGDYVSSSNEIFGYLARSNLVREPPQYVEPLQVLAHITAQTARATYRAVWIRRIESGSAFRSFPEIVIFPALVIERADNAFVTVVDRRIAHEYLPDLSANVPLHLNAVSQKSDELLNNIAQVLPGLPAPSPPENFPGFVRPPLRDASARLAFEPEDGGTIYLRAWPHVPDQFLLVTGDSAHFLLETPAIDPCAAHDWNECHNANQSVGAFPILSRSGSPASFFASAQLHHCAHQIIHARRVHRCKIQAFENYLCCQACTLRGVCWNGVDNLPCGMPAI